MRSQSRPIFNATLIYSNNTAKMIINSSRLHDLCEVDIFLVESNSLVKSCNTLKKLGLLFKIVLSGFVRISQSSLHILK